MRILITGGAGFIGSNLAARYHQKAQVRILDDLRTGQRRNLAGLNVEFIHGSILDGPVTQSAMQDVDYVFHLAAMVSVVESVRRPQECVEVNVIGLLNVLEAAAKSGVRKVCFSSSSAVYGNNPTVPKLEEMPAEPRSPYAVTKLDGEFYCRQFTETGRIETVALRFFNVFGPRQDLTGGYGAVVPRFFRQAVTGEPLVIFGDGKQTRDFIYVDDIVAALEFVAHKPGLTGVFNAGYGNHITILELAKRIIDLTGSHSRIEFEPERVADVRSSMAAVDRLSDEGFRPAGSLEAGLEKMVTYMRSIQVVTGEMQTTIST